MYVSVCMHLPYSGSAVANTLSQIYICAFLFAYIWWKKLHVTTWGGEGSDTCNPPLTVPPPSFSDDIIKCLSPPAGWSVESLQEWGSYMKLAIPSTLMKCFEWWIYEFGGFFAGNPHIRCSYCKAISKP